MMMFNRPIAVTVFGYFGAAFAALCMPPFYAQILQMNFSTPSFALAGWYFTLPTLAAAVANPLWGRLADRIGMRASLIRAHWGLCLSFVLTGLARSPLEFALGLTLQGLLGGAFAASNAYLASILPATRLAGLLSVMQASARGALFLGPAVIGLLSSQYNLLQVFFYLALFPALAGILLCYLPPAQDLRAATIDAVDARDTSGALPPCSLAPAMLYRLQALFTLGTVLSYPYFVIDLGARLEIGSAWAGVLFGLPHAMFLLLAYPLAQSLTPAKAKSALARYAGLTCAGLLLQALANDFACLLAGRLLMGVGMTGAYLAINTLAAATARQSCNGRHFGNLEGANKWGAVAAGVLASLAAAALGYSAPIWLGCAFLALLFILIESKIV